MLSLRKASRKAISVGDGAWLSSQRVMIAASIPASTTRPRMPQLQPLNKERRNFLNRLMR